MPITITVSDEFAQRVQALTGPMGASSGMDVLELALREAEARRQVAQPAPDDIVGRMDAMDAMMQVRLSKIDMDMRYLADGIKSAFGRLRGDMDSVQSALTANTLETRGLRSQFDLFVRAVEETAVETGR